MSERRGKGGDEGGYFRLEGEALGGRLLALGFRGEDSRVVDLDMRQILPRRRARKHKKEFQIEREPHGW